MTKHFRTAKALHLLIAITVIGGLNLAMVLPARGCGRDFFLCDPSSLPEGGATLFLPTFSWDHDDEDEYEISLGLVHPLTKRLAFDAYISFADEGEGWDIESVAPGVLMDLTPDMEHSPLRFGFFGTYKFAINEEEEDEFVSGNQLDARDGFEGRFIVETDIAEDTGLVFNLLGSAYDGKGHWGYAAGIRHEFKEDLGGSIEAIGDFKDSGKHQLFANAWWEPTEGIVLRVGAGFGLSDRAEDFTLLTGMVFEF